MFFTPELADGLSLKSQRQQVFSGPPDTPEYSGWSQQWRSLDGVGSPSNF